MGFHARHIATAFPMLRRLPHLLRRMPLKERFAFFRKKPEVSFALWREPFVKKMTDRKRCRTFLKIFCAFICILFIV